MIIKKQTLKRNTLLLLLILIAVFNHVIKEPKIATAIGYAGLVPFLFTELKYKRFYLMLLPLILILISGLLFSYSHFSTDVIRDVFYFINPLIFMILGGVLAMNINFELFLKYIILVGTSLSVVYIVETLLNFGFNIFANQAEIRGLIGVGNPLSIMALVLAIYNKRYDILNGIFIKKNIRLFTFINMFSMFLFGSRTYFVIFLVFLLFLSYPLLKRNALKYFIIVFVILSFIFLIFQLNKENFIIQKALYTINEISANQELDDENIYLNFRGYETLMAIDTYMQGDFFEKFFGHGLGKLIDLKMDVYLGGSEWQFIPVLHNGYAYLLVKAGVVGVFFFFLFLLRSIILSKSIFHRNNILSLFLLASVFSIYIVNYVVSAFFNMEFILLMIVIGSLLQYSVIESIKLHNLNTL